MGLDVLGMGGGGVANPSAELVAVNIGGNTTGTTANVSSGTVVLAGGNNITLSQNANSITISAGAATNSFWRPVYPGNPAASTYGNSSLYVFPVQQQGWVSASQANLLVSASVSTSSNSSHAGTLSMYLGIFTRSGSTLSSVSSGSQSYAWTNTSDNSTSRLSNIKIITLPINVNMSPGDYWLGFLSVTASANANWISISNVAHNQSQIQGSFGAAVNNSNQIIEGFGRWQSDTLSIPTSVPFSQITGTEGNRNQMMPMVWFNNHS